MLLLILKKRYWEAFARGEKTTEFRRHRPPFVARTFAPGRLVRLSYNYDLARYPRLVARIADFEVRIARDHPELLDVYPELRPDDELALIHLAEFERE